MPEGKGEMPGPEVKPSGNQPEAQVFQPSWVLEKQGEFTDPFLQRTVGILHKTPEIMLSRNRIESIYFKIQDKIIDGEVDETEADTLMARISARIEEIDRATVPVSPNAPDEGRLINAVDKVVQAAESMSTTTQELLNLMRNSGQLQPSLTPEQIVQMTATQISTFLTAYSRQENERLRGLFGRLPPELEESRWVDVEYDQEFYTRFQPNQEPNFYTALGTEQRKIWDARWRLARAAYVKKVLGAQPEKLCENQDLIELTKEQMETLYQTPGVKHALEWYASAIVLPVREQKVGGKILLDCESGKDLEEFRKIMRENLNGVQKWDKMRLIGEGRTEAEAEQKAQERELSEAEKKSADAIAWNWICCGNLVESIDSRYSVVKIKIRETEVDKWRRRGAFIRERRYQNDRGETVRTYTAIIKGLGRHENLAPAVCSDDLRAVFHPQEKAEDKYRNNQEWGNFGRWGAAQLRRIKNEFREYFDGERDKKKRAKIVFEPARIKEEFWVARFEERNEEIEGERKTTREVIVKAPECYPVISMKSFFETYQDSDSRKTTLLEKLISGQPIDWKEVQADPWKTNYLTVRLRKAVGFFGVFTVASKEGWARALLDIYTRLNSKEVLKDYYEGTLDLPTQRLGQEAERLAYYHFHNLKVWADYAVQGGVGRPQDRLVTDPYSTSLLGQTIGENRRVHEHHLRRPQVGYLDEGESLLIVSVV